MPSTTSERKIVRIVIVGTDTIFTCFLKLQHVELSRTPYIFDSYEYIVVFLMVENPVLDIKIKHFLFLLREGAVLGCLECYIIKK